MPTVIDPVTGKRSFVRGVHLNKKQRAFVAAYDGNAKAAALAAGYCAASGANLLRQPKIIEALQKKASVLQNKVKAEVESGMTKAMVENARLVSGAIAAREDRQAFWTRVMLSEDENMMFRLKASELLGKAQGDFIERHEHSGGVALLVVNPYDDERASEVVEVEDAIVRTEEVAEKTLGGGE